MIAETEKKEEGQQKMIIVGGAIAQVIGKFSLNFQYYRG
jgi:hypothetical protein